MDRRTFLKTGGAFMLGASLDPTWFASAAHRDRILIMVQLAGGNDGLNTVVPYRDPLYRQVRPNVALKPAEIYPLSGRLGLHPSLARVYELYEQGNVAVVSGLGYANHNRSHFVSTDIWHSTHVPPLQTSGWLGRLADYVLPDEEACDECCRHPLAFGALLPLALRAHTAHGGSFTGQDQFDVRFPIAAPDNLGRLRALYNVPDHGDRETLRQLTEVGLSSLETMRAVAGRIRTTVDYPVTGFAQFLRLAAQMLADGLAPTVFHAGIGGFDTHADQRTQHDKSLKTLGDGVYAFMRDLQRRGLDERVLIATYSEFGRRVHENASRGTDHGAAGPHFIIGAPVRGGLYGPVPDLSHLKNGDIPFHIDFRSYYATILERWLSCSSSTVLGASYPLLSFL